MKILVLNCGSSSIKYKLFDMTTKEVIAQGGIEKIGLKGSFLKLTLPNGEKKILEKDIPEHTVGVEFILNTLINPEYGAIKSLDEINAVGHRMVHGGERFSESVLLNKEVLEAFAACNDLAPLHNPANLKGVNAVSAILPNIPQVGVFDTAFHQTMPDYAYMYAIPHELYEKYGVRRYGFHGTSHRYVSKRVCEFLGVNLQASIDDRKDLTLSGQEIILQGNDSVLTSIPEIGYPYSVEFEIYADPKPNIDAVLFKGPHSVFTANWQNTGKFAFSRDGYEFIFHSYRLPVEKWTKVRVEGDAKGTSLYINGELQERLEGRIGVVYNQKSLRKDSIWYQETLIFPLKQIGDKLLGFKGRIRNVICTPLNEKRYSL